MKYGTRLVWKILGAAVVVGGIISCAHRPINADPWISLFDGKSLNGWTKKGGDALYRVENSTIVGSTVYNTPNTFLATEQEYGNFILELEYKVDPSMNSGIQVRSNSYDHYKNGVVHGYQIEIDPSERAWSGGIYDESRRGWLFPLEDNPLAQKAFRQNDWNHYRVEAIGDSIRTWINGVPAAFLVDDETSKGFIALQVHGIRSNDKEGTEIKWRNIRIITEDPVRYSRAMHIEPVYTNN